MYRIGEPPSLIIDGALIGSYVVAMQQVGGCIISPGSVLREFES